MISASQEESAMLPCLLEPQEIAAWFQVKTWPDVECRVAQSESEYPSTGPGRWACLYARIRSLAACVLLLDLRHICRGRGSLTEPPPRPALTHSWFGLYLRCTYVAVCSRSGSLAACAGLVLAVFGVNCYNWEYSP